MTMENTPGKKVCLMCDRCGKNFLRPAVTIRKDQKNIFCSRECLKKSPEEKIQTKKECRKRWDDANRDHVRKRGREWRINNPERNKAHKRKEWLKNREKYRISARNNYKKNRDVILSKNKDFYLQNKEIIKARAKEWAKENKDWIRERSSNYRKNNPAAHMSSRVKGNCKKMGVECDMTEEWFKERLDMGVCEMSGLPFDMHGKRTPNSPSIDRIIPGGSYTKGNCRLILWSLNRALSNHGEDYMINVFENVLKKRGRVLLAA